MRKVIIAGGTGFLGKILTSHFVKIGVHVVVLTRQHQLDEELVRYVKWDGKSLGPWTDVLNEADALINLTGKSVDCRYTEQNKQLIYDSRLDATYVLGLALGRCQSPPKVWINAASATIYRHAEDREMDEETGELGTGFSVDVCKKWEQAFFESRTPGIRKVALRIAIALGRQGGALEPLKRLVKCGLGGSQGNGRQYFSWIHEDDFTRSVMWVIGNESANGIYNVSAPRPVPNSEFMSRLRSAMGGPLGLPSPRWMLSLGAMLIQTEPELILKSRRVVPRRLKQEGFEFRYSTVQEAIEDLVE